MNTWLSILRILAFVIGLGTLGITVPALVTKPVQGLPKGFHLPSLSLEWAQDKDQANSIFKVLMKNDAKTKQQILFLNIDSWIIVPMYVVFFIGLGIYLWTSGTPVQRMLIVGIIIAVLVAGLADLIENHRTLLLIDSYVSKKPQGGLDESDSVLLLQKYRAYAMKWAFHALVLACVGILFSLRGNLWVGLPNVAAALVLGIGLIGSNSIVEWGFAFMGLGVTIIGACFKR